MGDETKAQGEYGPKIVTDEDWKQQAKKEKERLTADPGQADAGKAEAMGEAAGSAGASGAGGRGPLPSADFLSLVNTLMLQSMYSLGHLAAKGEKPPEADLDLAKYHIDTLGMLEEKTKGNLSEAESHTLGSILQELRMLFVYTAKESKK